MRATVRALAAIPDRRARARSQRRVRLQGAILAFVIALAVIAGVALRFDHLSGKVFWQDEAYTALHASGHLDHRDLRPLFNGAIRPASDLHRLEEAGPRSTLGATMKAIAAEDSDQGPLFYAAEWIAAKLGASTIEAYRLPSAIFGVLCIPAAWWLGLALFRRRAAAAAFAAIVALSPFEVLYAHEARAYALTALMVLTSSALLLRALSARRAGPWWTLYALAAALSLYANLLLALALAAHLCYAALRGPARRTLLPCALALLAAGLLFAPWVWVLLANRGLVGTELNWGDSAYSVRQMAEKWAFNVSAQFFDLEWLSLKFAAAGAAIIALSVASIILLVRRAPARCWTFVLLLGGLAAVFFIGRDALDHSHWSTTARYLIPTWLALQLCVAFALTRRRSVWGMAALIALLALEGVSSAIGTRASSWYDDALSAPVPGMAATINAAPRALVVGERSWAFYLELSTYLHPNVKMELFSGAGPERVRTAGFATVFVPDPAPKLRAALVRDGYRLRAVYAYRERTPYASFHRATLRSGGAAAAHIAENAISFPRILYRAHR